jgi:hypothetical protein
MNSIVNENGIRGFFGEYRWLSNYHACPILWQGMGFTSTEAAYQASKCTNLNEARKFQDYTPPESKRAGKLINIRSDWDKIKYNVMAQITFQKYLIHPELQLKLVETGDRYLEETNTWHDSYWGVCNGKGQNNLGKILMDTRRYFKRE